MAIGDVYKLVCGWRNLPGSRTCANVFYFRQQDALVLDTPGEDLVEAFTNAMLSPYIGLVTSQLILDNLVVGMAPGFETEHAVTSFGQTGQLSGDPLPPRTAGLIAYRSAVLTRRGRGRIFLPPATEAHSGGGAMAASYQTLCNSFVSAWESMNTLTVTTSAWTPMLWSETDQVAREITSFQVRPRWSSQRDRGQLY